MERRDADVEYEQMLLSRYAIAQHRTEDGLERSAYLLLSRLHVQGPMSIAELSEAFRLDASTLQRQTTAAMKAGLIERIPDPDGGMARKLVISADGLERLQRARTRYVSAIGEIMGDWSAGEVSQFADLLRRFNEAIEQRGAATWPRKD